MKVEPVIFLRGWHSLLNYKPKNAELSVKPEESEQEGAWGPGRAGTAGQPLLGALVFFLQLPQGRLGLHLLLLPFLRTATPRNRESVSHVH